MTPSRLVLAGWLLWPLAAQADFNAILWDNDFFSPRHTDAYYTNGIVYHHVDDDVPVEQGRDWAACPGLAPLARWLGPVLVPLDSRPRFSHSWEVGQIIETPLDKRALPPRADDQPYAGLLYAGCHYHLRTRDRMESLGLQYGVVGPWSLAEESQHLAHRLAGVKEARGWPAQLRNELVANLRYDRQEVIGEAMAGEAGFRFFDNIDFAVGTLVTSASAGVNLLYARNPDAVFGLNPNYLGRYPRIGDAPAGFYALASLQVNGVLRNLFLDGNTWVDSPASVESEPLLASAQLLVGYGFSCWALQLGLNVSTRAFQTQGVEWPRFGTLALSWGCR
ncbi:MAG TPA: lipid A deacylase LpxR family protein [Moraxellaceae bacterium]|nr:lipid A deacylase LpxR family protein [Moraxellaceae bacterium]